ncbi:STAS domain-containing protein [Rhodovastum atsumiense]|uniref:STAS domain-containing protein n=1 Tax=Rhodovastum atsumiense TaxID=504468 RepID=A0A5M6IWA7_9PROT|nr:ABC transporter permease [Rhodovastum atsumiense]KAA5611685.1 hypothetical protein F1189_12865 [Rhodovastum atsumiense]CAH2604257.1 STAS domain-containing protein [Rhodovastum atsumiense]
MPPQAVVNFEAVTQGTTTVLTLRGHLDIDGAGRLWTEATRRAGEGTVVDLAALAGCDSAGAALLVAIERRGGRLESASAQVAAMLGRARNALQEPPPVPTAPPTPWYVTLRHGLDAMADGFAYLGEAVLALLALPRRLRQFRRIDLLRTADQAGVRAVPLILLLGVLMGLILAFQSLIPMRRFGADIFVANLVAISLLRELGPLLAAVVLAGRSGSAFAAEIGTMKVNEEIDALTTMGVDPMTMLVLPRLSAAMLVMPVLTVLLELAGLVGMTLVLVASGIPLVAVGNQVAQWVRPQDFYGGLAKAVVFGAVVAAIGCRAGLAAGVGPRAVGQAATAAVVGGIVATIVLDGVFAVLFYRLGL